MKRVRLISMMIVLLFLLSGCSKGSVFWLCEECGKIASGDYCSKCGAVRVSGSEEQLTEVIQQKVEEIVDSGAGFQGVKYTYLHDKWGLYVAERLSQNIIKIERWWRFDAGEDGDPFTYQYDLCTIDIRDESTDFSWCDSSHSAFKVTLNDPQNYEWDEPLYVGFAKNINFTESNVLTTNGIVYSYRNDAWDHYVAIPLSETTYKIEVWGQFYAWADAEKLKYYYDYGIVCVDDESNDFKWLDEEKTAFTITMMDLENADWEEEKKVVFTTNKGFPESSAMNADKIYTYLRDPWDLYVATIVSPTVVRVEKWCRFYADDEEGDPFVYFYDISLDSERESFSWLDDSETAFSITMRDLENGEWNELSTVTFTIDSDFEEKYIKPLIEYAEKEEESENLNSSQSEDNSESEPNLSEESESSIDSDSSENTNEDNIITEDNFTYEIKDDKCILISYSGSESTIFISDTVKDYKVVEIGESAFEGNTYLEEVYIYADIERFGEKAFKDCVSLKMIEIPSTTKEIGAHAFEGCTSLKDVYVFGDPEIREYAFKNCVHLEQFDIPFETKEIGAHAFEGCTELKNVYFWGGETIGEYAFAGCVSIVDLYFSESLIIIQTHAFDGCSNLKSVEYWWGTNPIIEEGAFSNCPKLEGFSN